MDMYKLGELPVSLRAWAKFRPVDGLDFSRRAKNLATLLKMPLQKTQDAFALACGYSGKHELQQILEQAGIPGPFDDDIPAEILDEIQNARAIVQFYRHAKLLSAVEGLIGVRPERMSQSDATVCDLNLFSTPATHRAAAKALTEFLSGGSGFAIDGFPYGYRGVVHSRYLGLESVPFDEAALKELEAGWALEHPSEERVFDPRAQARALLRYRAPILFVEMAKTTASSFVVESPEMKIDIEVGMWLEDGDSDVIDWLLADVDAELAYHLCSQNAVDPEGEEFNRLLAALRSPVPILIAASSIASAIVDFANQIPRWRLSLRYQWATDRRDNDIRDWHDGESGPAVLLEGVIYDGGFAPGGIEDDPRRWLSVCMQKEHINIAQVRWRVSATLFLAETDTAPWKAVAVLTGDHIIAATEKGYAGPDEVALYHDDVGNDELSTVWKILVNLYRPVAGYLNYHEWINNLGEGGGVVAILDPWVAPAHRGSNISRLLLDSYTCAFDDGTGYSSDSLWRNWIDPRSDYTDMETRDDDETEIPGPGVMFIPLPGSRMLGYSVWELDRDEPMTKVLRHDGKRIGLPTRWGPGEPIKGGIGLHFLEIAKKVKADIVVFDPDDAGNKGYGN